MFTSNSTPSVIEILVRTGKICPPERPIKSERGLKEMTGRDGVARPFFLPPLLARPDLQRFEPKSETTPVPNIKFSSPEKQRNIDLKEWMAGLNGLGEKGTVGISQTFVDLKPYPKISWENNELRNLVVFRFHCYGIPGREEANAS
jgi:hypothetical protein